MGSKGRGSGVASFVKARGAQRDWLCGRRLLPKCVRCSGTTLKGYSGLGSSTCSATLNLARLLNCTWFSHQKKGPMRVILQGGFENNELIRAKCFEHCLAPKDHFMSIFL